MGSIEPWRSREPSWLQRNVLELFDRTYDLVDSIAWDTYEIYYWLNDVAPVLLKYKVKQLGRNGIDRLPFIPLEVKREIKQWLIDYYGW